MRGKWLWLIYPVALLITGDCLGQQALKPTDTDLKTFLQSYLKEAPDTSTRFLSARFDLNEDAKPETIVYLTGPSWCGSGGCLMLVLESANSSFKVVGRTTIVWPPIRIFESRSHRWHNIGVRVGGGGIQGYEAVLSFDGKTYPKNPTVPPARKAAENIKGLMLPLPDVGTPLY